MVTLVLGAEPESLVVHLSPGAPFTATIRATDDAGAPMNWPAGCSLRLVILENGIEHSWPFTISADYATVMIPELEVNALPDWPAPKAQLWVTYADAGEFLWCAGEVRFNA